MWTTDRVHPLRILCGYLSDVDVACWHPNMNYVAAGSSDRCIQLWEAHDGNCVCIVLAPDLVTALVPDGGGGSGDSGCGNAGANNNSGDAEGEGGDKGGESTAGDQTGVHGDEDVKMDGGGSGGGAKGDDRANKADVAAKLKSKRRK